MISDSLVQPSRNFVNFDFGYYSNKKLHALHPPNNNSDGPDPVLSNTAMHLPHLKCRGK